MLQANKVLNKVSVKLNKKYKNTAIKVGFTIGFDALWELVIQNTKTDRAIVIKESNRASKAQEVFIYAESFDNQLTHSEQVCVRDKDIESMCSKLIPLLSK
tara:strand:- start:2 stop:304 length:303 start_codon:yes stop_codon:yes gene_type:complete